MYHLLSTLRKPYLLITESIYIDKYIAFTPLWANSADDKLVLFFLFFPENRLWHLKQRVSLEDSLHEMLQPIFWWNYGKYFKMLSAETLTQRANDRAVQGSR